MNKIILIVSLIALIAMGERLYNSAYDKGRMDAQNDNIFKGQYTCEMSVEKAIEDAKWECLRQKEDLIDRCNKYCGKISI